MPYNLRNMKLPSFLYTDTSAVALIAEEYWAQVFFAYPEPGDDEVYFTWGLSRDADHVDSSGEDAPLVAPLKYHSPALWALWQLLEELKTDDKYAFQEEDVERVIADIHQHQPEMMEWEQS